MKVMKRMRQLFPANCSLVSCQTPTAAEAQGLGEGSLHSHSMAEMLAVRAVEVAEHWICVT